MKVNNDFSGDWMKDFDGYVADLLDDGVSVLIYGKDLTTNFVLFLFLLVTSCSFSSSVILLRKS